MSDAEVLRKWDEVQLEAKRAGLIVWRAGETCQVLWPLPCGRGPMARDVVIEGRVFSFWTEFSTVMETLAFVRGVNDGRANPAQPPKTETV